jgi:hypothetical protein
MVPGERVCETLIRVTFANLREAIGKAVLAFSQSVMKNFTKFYGAR